MWFKYVTSTLLLAIVICCVPNSFANEDEDNATKYPYLVSVRVDGIHLCTGTIVAPTWILTANSCIPPETSLNRLTIQYGVQKLTHGGGIPIRNLVRYLSRDIHQPYIGDIALIGLQEPLPYNDKVSPVVLPKEEIDLAGKLTVLEGWTLNMNDTDYSFGDKEATTLKVESNNQCAKQLSSLGSSSVNFCTKYDGDATTYPCFLFGGPLMYNGMQVGIASRRQGTEFCALPNVYTRISHYIYWINRNISN